MRISSGNAASYAANALASKALAAAAASLDDAAALAREEARVLREVQQQTRGADAETLRVRYDYTLGSDGKRYITAAHVSFREKADSRKSETEGSSSEKGSKAGGDGVKSSSSATYGENPEVQAAIKELQRTDREVRAHEAAHMAVGGQYAGSASYSYTVGPDGKRYAVGGEVPISAPEGDTPEETIRIMQRVQAAALAPGNPSGQDLRVAAMAASVEARARSELHASPEAEGMSEDAEKPGGSLSDMEREEKERPSGLFILPETFSRAYQGPWITGITEPSTWSMAV
ncbi:MAG TPA: putative metalloprotease CJM1_0395 family protein [Synergistaceae bacterium]|nr:putative metalloprotease CJM1_0395 family protein [Synergistaceae bacterium]